MTIAFQKRGKDDSYFKKCQKVFPETSTYQINRN